ncbi:MAG: hypothetical protein M1817_004085 [Caeruleum heppii]|nr:MAG: hypothetical protein M1817_004085 [Caeruleum heppii]
MSFPMTQLGGQALNHTAAHSHAPTDIEAEYDRLRDLARHEHGSRASCFDRSRQAYERGDGAGAHELSEQGKRHGRLMEQYNAQARDFIFRENNADGRVPADTIDLHGLFVEEAEDILEQRIKFAQGQGQRHLHVIVGKGIHSTSHVNKLRPRVERVCHELRLQYETEPNAGRMYIDLTGGRAHMPPAPQFPGGHHQPVGAGRPPQHAMADHPGVGGQQGYSGHQQPHHQQPHQQQHQHQPSHQRPDRPPQGLIPKVLHKLGCCVVM